MNLKPLNSVSESISLFLMTNLESLNCSSALKEFEVSTL